MMKIDLTPLMTGRVREICFEEEIDPSSLGDETAAFPKEITLKGPIRCRGSVRGTNGYFTLDATLCADYTTYCDRCLDEIERELEIPFSRLVSVPGKSGDAGEEEGIDPEDLLFAADSSLDPSSAMVEELSLEVPFRHLCREDCPGLCPRCGKKLSLGPCGCESVKEIDPRLAILQKLLDKSEDV